MPNTGDSPGGRLAKDVEVTVWGKTHGDGRRQEIQVRFPISLSLQIGLIPKFKKLSKFTISHLDIGIGVGRIFESLTIATFENFRVLKLTNPRYKSRSDLGFSLKSDFPTTHPPPPTPEKVSNKQHTAI